MSDRVNTPRLTDGDVLDAERRNNRGGVGDGGGSAARPEPAAASRGEGPGASEGPFDGGFQGKDPNSPHSTTFPNLRGAAARASDQQQQSSVPTVERLLLERDVKIDINIMPSSAVEYAVWRFHVEVELLCCGIDMEVVSLYLDDLNNADSDEMLGPLPRELKSLDGKLYKALVKQVRGKDNVQYLNAIRTGAIRGYGRQALRVLDKQHEYDASRNATRAALAIIGSTCAQMNSFQKYVTGFKLELQNLDAAKTPLPPSVGLVLLKKGVENLQDKDVAATLAAFRTLPREGQTLPTLLDRLEETANEWMEKHGEKKEKTAGVASSFRGKCHYCGTEGHKESECKKKVKDQKGGKGNPGSSGATGAYADGGKKGDGKTKKGKGGWGKEQEQATFPKCPYCSKTNHSKERCFFRPGGPGHRGKDATGSPGGPVTGQVIAGASPTVGATVVPPAPTLESVLAQLIASKVKP